VQIKILLIFLISLCITFTCFAQKQGRARIDSLLNDLAHSKDDTNKVNLLGDLSYSYYGINPDSGINFAEQALTISEKLQWKKGIAYANNKIGVNYWAKADFPKAQEYYLKALKINEELGNKIEIAKNLSNIGLVYTNQSQYAKGLEYYFNALKLDEELKDKKGIAYIMGNIGIVYSRQAAERLDSASKINIDKQEKERLQTSANNDCAKALEYYSKALKIFEEAGNKYEVARNLANIGVVYGVLLDYTQALDYYFKALEIERALGHKYGFALNLGNIGTRYMEIAKDTINRQPLNKIFGGNKMAALKQAKLYLDSSIVIKKEIGELDYLKNSYRTLSEVLELMGDTKGALKNYRDYSALKDSIFSSQNQEKLTKLQLQYDLDKKEAVIKAQQEKQKLIRNIIYSGLGIAVIFLFILLIQRNKIAKERRLIALEQERTRISRDLHDDLGSGLTGILMMSEQLQSSSAKEQTGNNIEKIKQSSRQMVDQMGEIVWAMNSKNDSLENLVGYLNTYARDYFENTNINHQIQIPESIPDAMLTGPMRRNIFLVVKESLNNISKHANATNVNLQMNIEGKKMNITLTDNGNGFDPAQTRRFGNGLKNMQSRMADIKGTYTIQSEIQKGTKTTITFPINS